MSFVIKVSSCQACPHFDGTNYMGNDRQNCLRAPYDAEHNWTQVPDRNQMPNWCPVEQKERVKV